VDEPCCFGGTKKVATWSPPLPPEMSVTIWCFLAKGEHIFPVDIDETKTVGHLKAKIKEQMSPILDHIAAFSLRLYEVGTPKSDTKQKRISYLKSKNLDEIEELDEEQDISVILGVRLPEEKYYILIQRPLGQSHRSEALSSDPSVCDAAAETGPISSGEDDEDAGESLRLFNYPRFMRIFDLTSCSSLSRQISMRTT